MANRIFKYILGTSIAVICVISIAVAYTVSGKMNQNSTLRHLSVVFRHGDRTPDVMWPTFENQNENFYPYGLGELTNEGKTTAYNLGLALRAKYDSFLGDIVLKDTIKARSSQWSRAKATLGYVLAGLYPPRGVQKWHGGLQWQAIPTEYVPIMQDKMFIGCFATRSKAAFFENFARKEVQDEFKKFENLLQYMTEHSGWDTKDIVNIMRFFYEIQAFEKANFELPVWATKVYPEVVKELVVFVYNRLSDTNFQLKNAAGFLLQDILNTIKGIMNGSKHDRKINLYSGHEINIAFGLKIFGLFDNKPPTYGAYLIFELHEIGSQFFIRFLHQNYEQKNPIILTIPGCAEMCPIDKFYELLKDKLPTKEEEEDVVGELTLRVD